MAIKKVVKEQRQRIEEEEKEESKQDFTKAREAKPEPRKQRIWMH